MKLPAIMELLIDNEPKWKTHPLSIWNRVRREIETLNGNIISEALSWNPDTKEWEM